VSLAIDVDNVTEVLLADGWHVVLRDSFDLDSYEYISANEYQRERDDFTLLHGGGNSGICSIGFSFLTGAHTRMAGPLSAVLAVKYRDV